MLIFALDAPVNAKHAALRIITHMAGVNDHHVLPVLGVGRVAIGGNDAADLAMIERKYAKVFADENDRIALVFIRAKRPRGHDLARGETQRFAQIIQTGNETAVAQHHISDVKISHQGADIGSG